ncbi:unnamed protein product [Vicia faba]|uniref:Uncharacterized protein n=1 Tax=Vicia faba TaxID=3906 RepID=A0AAV1A3I6_VICFA|nr:unnamed protein product [Vicia faba]
MEQAASIVPEHEQGGDFNDILSASDKRGGAKDSEKKRDVFRERIESCNLMDLGSSAHRYTWRGPIYQGGVGIYERLDRAMSNDIWRLQFPNASVKVLTRMEFSDHHPILISLKDENNTREAKRFHLRVLGFLRRITTLG